MTERRWCLTGTPIQNRLEDLGSLIKFLRITPFDSNAEFRKYILEPLGSNRKGCDENLRLLLGSVFLRRTRNLLQVPEPKCETLMLSLSAEEKSRYCRIISESQRKIDDSISSKSLAKAYNSILQVILRLRIFCNNGSASSDTGSISQPDYSDALVTGQDAMVTLIQGSTKLACAFCSYEIDLADTTNDESSTAWQRHLQILCPACLSQNEVHLKKGQPQGRDRCLVNTLTNQMTYSTESRHSVHDEGAIESPGLLDSQQCLTHLPSSKLAGLVSDIRQHLQKDKRYASTNKTTSPLI